MRTREGMKLARARWPAARPTAEAQRQPGSASSGLASRWFAYQQRARRTVFRRPLYGLPGDPTRWVTVLCRW